MLKTQIIHIILFSGFILLNQTQSIASTFTLPINVNTNEGTTTGNVSFNSDCTCNGIFDFPGTEPPPRTLEKYIQWIIKWIAPKPPVPLPNPPLPPVKPLSLLDLSGGNLSGSVFVDNQLSATFQVSYSEANIVIENTGTPSPIPSNSYMTNMTETIIGAGAGAALGTGSYLVNDQLISNYTVNYDFDGNPSATVNEPFTINLATNVERDLSDPSQVTFSGRVGGDAICTPEPNLAISLLLLGTSYLYATNRRKKTNHTS